MIPAAPAMGHRRTLVCAYGLMCAALGVFLRPAATHAQVPSQVVSQAIATECEVTPDPHSQAVVAGVVQDSVSGVGLPEAKVSLTWRDTGESAPTTEVRTTGQRGFFAFCNVPAGVNATLMVRRRVTRGPFMLQISPGQLYVQKVLVPLSTETGDGTLLGHVIDAETKRPVVNATVRLVELGQATTTNSRGYFTFGAQPFGIYTLEVEGLGYQERAAPVRVSADVQQSVEVQVSRHALELEGLTVTVAPGRSSFDMDGLVRRMTLGFGSFVTRDELDSRPMARLSDLLRGTPGIFVYVDRLDHTFTLGVRGLGCVPDVFVNGVRYTGPLSDLDFPRAEDLEAVEIYRGIAEIPGIYVVAKRERQCAVIAMWTRRFR